MIDSTGPTYRPPSPDDPSVLARLQAWYDRLTDLQRVQYGVAGMLFLLACGGYLLGLGSTVLLRRVEAEESHQLATQALTGVEGTPTATAVAEMPTLVPATAYALATPSTTESERRSAVPTPFAPPPVTVAPVAPRVPVQDPDPDPAPRAVPTRPRIVETTREPTRPSQSATSTILVRTPTGVPSRAPTPDAGAAPARGLPTSTPTQRTLPLVTPGIPPTATPEPLPTLRPTLVPPTPAPAPPTAPPAPPTPPPAPTAPAAPAGGGAVSKPVTKP